MPRALAIAALGTALLAFAALRIAAIHTQSFNWDELALLFDVYRSAEEGRLHSSGHPGLPQALLIPWIEGCRDEISAARGARGLWLGLTWTALAGVFAMLWQLLPEDRHRLLDAALGTSLLGLAPVFLEWSIQVRTDQVALCGGTWGAAALLASRRRPLWALAAGAALGLGWLGTQKLAYLAALAGLLAAGDLFVRGELRPRREALRTALVSAAALGVIGAWHLFVRRTFEMDPLHPTAGLPSAQRLSLQFDIFDFYRSTIGYSQYVDALPGLAPLLLLLAAGPLAALLGSGARTRRAALALAVAALGGLVGAFHAGAFAYFLMILGVFAVTAVSLALPSVRAVLNARWPDAARPAAAVTWAALVLGVLLQCSLVLRDPQAVQRESLRFVHRNFSDDRAGFHPEAGLFCGANQPLGVWFSQRIHRTFESEHRESNIERLLARFHDEPVHYLVQSFRLNQFPVAVRRFWDEHYQPYRASVFVAGRRLRADHAEGLDFELLVPGAYHWLPQGGPHPVEIDGRPLAPGGVVLLGAGPHRARFDDAGGRGALMLALEEPPGPAPQLFYQRP